METTFVDNFWSELVGQTIPSFAYNSVTIKNIFHHYKIIEVLYDTEIAVNNNEFVLSCSIFHMYVYMYGHTYCESKVANPARGQLNREN